MPLASVDMMLSQAIEVFNPVNRSVVTGEPASEIQTSKNQSQVPFVGQTHFSRGGPCSLIMCENCYIGPSGWISEVGFIVDKNS